MVIVSKYLANCPIIVLILLSLPLLTRIKEKKYMADYRLINMHHGFRRRTPDKTGCRLAGNRGKRPRMTVYGEASHDLGVEVVEEVDKAKETKRIYFQCYE